MSRSKLSSLLTFLVFFSNLKYCCCQTKTICNIIDDTCVDVPDFQRGESHECQCYIHGLIGNVCADDVINGVKLLPTSNTSRAFPVPSTGITPLLRFLLLNAECRYTLTSDGPQNITMINSCPRETTQPELIAPCEDDRSYPPITYNGPIGMTFQNVYCARCHNLTNTEKYILWQPGVECEQDVAPSKSWKEIESRLHTGSCKYNYHSPKLLLNCNYYLTDIKGILEKECQTCIVHREASNNTKTSLDCLVCEIAEIVIRNVCFPSQSGVGSLVTLFKLPEATEVTITLNGALFKSSEICEDDENFDLMFQKCRRFECRVGQFPKRGECHENKDVFMEYVSQPLPNGINVVFVTMIEHLKGDLPLKTGDLRLKRPHTKSLEALRLAWSNKFPVGSFVPIPIYVHAWQPVSVRFILKGLENAKLLEILKTFSYSLKPLVNNLEIQVTNFLDTGNSSQHNWNPVNNEHDRDQTFEDASDRSQGEGNMSVPDQNTPMDDFLLQHTRERFSCDNGELICFADATVYFVKSDMFARLQVDEKFQLYPINNILYNLSLYSNVEDNLRLNEICVCVSDSDTVTGGLVGNDNVFDMNCSYPIYRYDASEYSMTTIGELKLGQSSIKFPESHVSIQNDSSALVCYDPTQQVNFFNMDMTQTYLWWACSALSILLLLLTLLTHLIFKDLRNLPGKITMQLAVFLILGQALLLLPDFRPSICQYAAAFTHFCWLSVFMLMSCQAYNMLVTFHPRFMTSSAHPSKNIFKIYNVVCLLVPAIICGSLLLMDAIPGDHFHVRYGLVACCWMADKYGYYFAFFLPVVITLTFNVVCFSLTLYHIELAMATCDGVTGRKRDRNRCVIYIKLSSVMGFSWIFGLIASVVEVPALWYIYILLNGLQGVFIFLSFTFNSRTRHLFTSSFVGSKFTNLFVTNSEFLPSHTTDSSVRSDNHTHNTSN